MHTRHEPGGFIYRQPRAGYVQRVLALPTSHGHYLWRHARKARFGHAYYRYPAAQRFVQVLAQAWPLLRSERNVTIYYHAAYLA
jgi:hypothetical protein